MDSLYTAIEHKKYHVKELPEIPLLQSLGVFQGAIIEKTHTYGFGGPVLLMIDNREVAVGKNYAKEIKVEEVG